MKTRVYLILSFILLLFVVSCSECGGGYLVSNCYDSDNVFAEMTKEPSTLYWS